MTASSEKLVLNQLPQPTRPPNSYDTRSMVKDEEGQRKFAFVSKLVNRVFDEYEKLPASFRDQKKVEEMLSEERKREVEESQNSTSRGLQQPVQEKLGRFKVRYVSTEEVVKDDDKK